MKHVGWLPVLVHVLFIFGCVGGQSPIADLGDARAKTHVNEGEDAFLTCVIRGAGDNTVMWKFDDKDRHSRRVLTAGETRVTADPRFRIFHDKGGDVWVLRIKLTKASDSGIYVCEVNSEPIVRSFHKLVVLSRELQPPKEGNATNHYGSDNVLEIEERSDPSELLNHNYTDCCTSFNVSAKCLGFCMIRNILEGNTGQDPEQCESDFPMIVHCMADGRNHVPCCIQEGVPDICQDVCRGEYTMITDNIKTHFSCSAYTEQTLACIVEGIEFLPSRPEGVQVEVLSESDLNVTWDKPTQNSASVTEYAVNVTMLKSFDNNPIFGKNIEEQNSSWIIVTPHSVQVKVQSTDRNVVIRHLTPYTMYEITVTAKNTRGSSLPSQAIRSVTLSVGKVKNNNNSKPPPPLPDIRNCCMKKGITHSTCLDKLCDPAQADATEVTDLMICAPWASQTYSCLTDGIDHTPCCKARGIPPLCQELCSGNLTQIDYSYFKCLRFMGDYTNCLMRGYGVVPSAPMNVRILNIDVTFAIVHWDTPKILGDTVNHYDVYYRQIDDIYYIARNVQSPYVLENLHTDSTYEVYVEAVNVHGPGEPSQRVVFRTLSVDLVAKEEEEPEVAYNVTECCVSAGLSDICLPLCSYDASMSQLKTLAGICGNEFHKLIRCGAGGRNHISCCERRGVSLNCIQICTGVISKSLTTSPASTCIPFIGNIVQCFEEGSGLLPGPVTELQALKLKNNSVILEWSAPKDGSEVKDYVVHYQQVTNGTVHETSLILDKQVTVKATTTKIENLETNKMYKIFVVSRNKHGTSLPSSLLLLNVTDKNDTNDGNVASITSPPHSLTVSSHSANFVTISWQPPEFSHPAERLYYRLFWRGNSDTSFHIIDTEVTTHMLENLSPNSQYIIYVIAISKNGQSASSETLIAWTDPAFPAYVDSPTVHPLNMVAEGASMTVLCIAMGTPMPTISLYISGRLVRQETTRHMVTVINNVTRDMNHISCYADNGYGTPMQSFRTITINYTPKLMPSGITMATLGDTVVLQCIVDAYPAPKMMFWRDPKGREAVIQSGKYSTNIIESKTETGKYTMQLTINKITDADQGDYYCHAENSFGFATQPVSVRIRNTPATHNVTQCCMQQNVSSSCMNACTFYLDIEAAMEIPECINDLNKLMKCASDGSDHRSCCGSFNVPRSCLDWCRGESVLNNSMCILSYTKPIMSCFREGRSKLPGPPQNVRVEILDSHSVLVKWDPPLKNPHTVEVYRVFWRTIGNKNPTKNDTKENSILISGLKDDVTYELVMKATNQIGSSMLTDPLKFSTTEKYITSAASLGEDEHAEVSTALSVITSFLIVGAIIGAGIYYLHSKQLLLRKSNANGVAFENPSYLREVSMDNIQSGENTYMSNGLANGVSNNIPPQGWKPEQLHVPLPTEVPPSLYEELRLGSNGAGFMRLKP
ncbi:hypothetical protein PGB90_010355 [Kerria lacca]